MTVRLLLDAVCLFIKAFKRTLERKKLSRPGVFLRTREYLLTQKMNQKTDFNMSDQVGIKGIWKTNPGFTPLSIITKTYIWGGGVR